MLMRFVLMHRCVCAFVRPLISGVLNSQGVVALMCWCHAHVVGVLLCWLDVGELCFRTWNSQNSFPDEPRKIFWIVNIPKVYTSTLVVRLSFAQSFMAEFGFFTSSPSWHGLYFCYLYCCQENRHFLRKSEWSPSELKRCFHTFWFNSWL